MSKITWGCYVGNSVIMVNNSVHTSGASGWLCRSSSHRTSVQGHLHWLAWNCPASFINLNIEKMAKDAFHSQITQRKTVGVHLPMCHSHITAQLHHRGWQRHSSEQEGQSQAQHSLHRSFFVNYPWTFQEIQTTQRAFINTVPQLLLLIIHYKLCLSSAH